jgi:hypothetical protein
MKDKDRIETQAKKTNDNVATTILNFLILQKKNPNNVPIRPANEPGRLILVDSKSSR